MKLRPNRDCSFFEIALDLTRYLVVAAEFDAHDRTGYATSPWLKELTQGDLRSIIRGLETLRKVFNNLTAARNGAGSKPQQAVIWPVSPILHPYIDQERVFAWCHALRMNVVLDFYPDDATTGPNEKDLADRIRKEINTNAGDASALKADLKLLFGTTNNLPDASILVSSWKAMKDTLKAEITLPKASVDEATLKGYMDNQPSKFCVSYATAVANVEAVRAGRPHDVGGNRFKSRQ